LYVFSDAPRHARDQEAVRATRQLIRTQDWADIQLIERDVNLGLAQSIVQGVTEVLTKHSSAIVLEDDCVPLAGFYAFMQRALMRYENDDDVACISGYGPARVRPPRGYNADGYFTHRISSWGWGTWRRAWSHLNANWSDIRRRVEAARPDLSAAGDDLHLWFEPSFEARIGREVWTPLWLFPLLLGDKKTLWPFQTYVRNIGFDASGVNSGWAVASAQPFAAVPPEEFRFPETSAIVPAITRRFATAIARRRKYTTMLARARAMLARSPVATAAYWRLRRILHLRDSNPYQTHDRLRRFTERTARYRPGSFKFSFGEIEYVDAASLQSQYREIFVERGYDFRSDNDHPVIFDCGGNVGLSVVRFKELYPNARIKVFEADPHIAALLQRNVDRLRLTDVTVVPAAVWDCNGQVGFVRDGADSGHVSASKADATVAAVRLADAIGEKVDLLKLDIEGAEFPVLHDLHQTGTLSRVQRLICEVHVRPDERTSVGDLFALLEQRDFRISVRHARTAPDLPGVEADPTFSGLASSKYLLHLYAWREHG
jgi:FkbM family methyltransferase